MIDFIDLFSGIGGFHKGLTDAGGFRCVYANDFDKYASKVYRSRFPETKFYEGDITGVEADSIPDHDLLCGGFPCQAFSVAGERGGFSDPRGTLFYQIARIAERKKPRLLLLENVDGLLNHDEGRTFATILWELGKLGYWCEWQVLNTLWFGVPQTRERVFIIGHLGAEPTRTIFPITETGESPYRRDAGKQAANALQSPGHASGNYRGMTMIVQPVLTPNRPEKRQNGRRFKEPGESSFTLTGQDIHGVMILKLPHGNFKGGEKVGVCLRTSGEYSQLVYDGLRIRRFMPVECERLQAFPDGWTSDSQ